MGSENLYICRWKTMVSAFQINCLKISHLPHTLMLKSSRVAPYFPGLQDGMKLKGVTLGQIKTLGRWSTALGSCGFMDGNFIGFRPILLPHIPSGKHTKNYGKTQSLIGKPTISHPFFIAMFVYQRVCVIFLGSLIKSMWAELKWVILY